MEKGDVPAEFGSNLNWNAQREQNEIQKSTNSIELLFVWCVSFSWLCRTAGGIEKKERKSVQFHAKNFAKQFFFLLCDWTTFFADVLFDSVQSRPVYCFRALQKSEQIYEFGAGEIMEAHWAASATHTHARSVFENDETTVWPVVSFDLVCRRRRRLQRAILYDPHACQTYDNNKSLEIDDCFGRWQLPQFFFCSRNEKNVENHLNQSTHLLTRTHNHHGQRLVSSFLLRQFMVFLRIFFCSSFLLHSRADVQFATDRKSCLFFCFRMTQEQNLDGKKKTKETFYFDFVLHKIDTHFVTAI